MVRNRKLEGASPVCSIRTIKNQNNMYAVYAQEELTDFVYYDYYYENDFLIGYYIINVLYFSFSCPQEHHSPLGGMPPCRAWPACAALVPHSSKTAAARQMT